MTDDHAKSDFDHLTPDVVLKLVEDALDTRCGNLCRPLNSYINRVYEVQEESGDSLIAKFYRPNRWSLDALEDEQDFLLELADDEIPVIAPIVNDDGIALHDHEGMYFALFEKKGGRICDEPSEGQWKELGRLIARVHVVGARSAPQDRITLRPDKSMANHLHYILESGVVTREHRDEYSECVHNTIEMITHLFDDVEEIRIHGDCHYQNIIYRPNESFYIIDFDDMATGPAVQDVWMLLPGRLADSVREMDLFLEGYETFRPLDHQSLRLIEPLRAMRFIHFTAWCARQAADGGFTRLAPDWGSAAYWKQEIHELQKQQTEILDTLEAHLF